jgi:hypothetical protein
VVIDSFGHFVAQFPMVVAMGFLLPSPIAKSPSLTIGGMILLVDVPSLPFG